MKRAFNILLASSALSIAAIGAASAQSLGGFPIREPGSGSPGSTNPGGSTGPAGSRSEVVVSQDAGSKVTSVAQAMKLVRPGGTILVKGGVYNENIVVTKPVEIRGVEGDYGRATVFRPNPSDSCVDITPDSPLATVAISSIIFEFDSKTPSGACIDVQGGTVSLTNSYILPSDSEIPLRAAYGPMRPGLIDHLARPPRDESREARRASSVEDYIARHSTPVGADNKGWKFAAGGTSIEEFMHVRATRGAGLMTGPSAGVRVLAGDVRLDGNVIIGARTAVNFESKDNAFIKGSLTNNVILGNGVGIAAAGVGADLLLTRNTIRYNAGEGVRADVYDGVKIIANEIMGNDTGIFLSEKVRMATVSSNLVAQNFSDAMRVSSGFFGAVGGNTFAENGGCTMQFFSAEQKILNNADIKVTAFRDFDPAVVYEATNYAVGNDGDLKVRKKKRRNKDIVDASATLAACDAPLVE